MKNILLILMTTSSLWMNFAHAQEESSLDFLTLDKKVQIIKNNTIKLGHDFALLQEGLSAIGGQELVIYVSLDVDQEFTPQYIDLEINGKPTVHRQFTAESIHSLLKGSVERIYGENTPVGEYTIKATLSGKIGKGGDYRKSVTLNVKKEQGVKTIELKITNLREKFLPELAVREW